LACLQGVGGAVVAGAKDENVANAFAIVSTCFSCLMGLWALLVGIISPAILIRFAEVGEFMAGFRFGEVFSVITSNVGSYVIVLLLMWVASLIGELGVIVCIVGVIFTAFWAYLVSGNLLGQLAAQYRQSRPAV